MPAYRALSFETPGQSIYIATPAYESVKAGYALSLAKTVQELTRRNIPHAINILYGNCHVDDGRNDCVRDFLENTQCTDLVFLDADVMWEPKDFLKLIGHKTADIIAGAYPFKSDSGKFPVGKILDGVEYKDGKEALLSVSYAPTGFMRIPRSVFEKLSPPIHGKLNPSRRFFARQYTDNTYDGGDVTFCRKWIAAGGKVWIDPSLTLGHIGENIWRGNFASYLTKPENVDIHTTKSTDPVPNYKPTPEEFAETFRKFGLIAEPSLADFEHLVDAYGNRPYVATAELLKAAYERAQSLPEGSKILECGSGLSTLVLALSGHKVTCVEEHKDWAARINALLGLCGLEADIMVAPVADGGWHEKAKAELQGFNAAMALIDGPRRRKGGATVQRLWPISSEALLAGVLARDAVVVIDDVGETQTGGNWTTMGTERAFAVGRIGEHKAAAE